jgi:hypothetical protein
MPRVGGEGLHGTALLALVGELGVEAQVDIDSKIGSESAQILKQYITF